MDCLIAWIILSALLVLTVWLRKWMKQPRERRALETPAWTPPQASTPPAPPPTIQQMLAQMQRDKAEWDASAELVEEQYRDIVKAQIEMMYRQRLAEIVGVDVP